VPEGPITVAQMMSANQTYYIVVDSLAGGGDAMLEVIIN
jgi:hypothetical protein